MYGDAFYDQTGGDRNCDRISLDYLVNTDRH